LIKQSTWFFFMTFFHVFSSWLSIKVKQSSCFFIMFLIMFLFMFFFMFLFMFLVMIFYQTIFMFSRHNFLSNDLHVSLSCFLYVSLHVFCHDFLSNDLHVFSSWLSIKKIMQKDNAKVGKISIFNSLDIKLEFLMNQVELTQFLVESSWIKLKICSIQLRLSWKYE